MPATARRVSAAELARQHAILAEQHAETLAPAAQRKPTTLRPPLIEPAQWRDPADLDPGRRAPRVLHGYRRVDTLRSLHKRGGQVTEAHLLAADLLSADYETGALGARPGSERSLVRVDGAPAGPGDRQLRALAAYRAAVQSVGIRGSAVLLPVALQSATLDDIAARLGCHNRAALGYLVAALDRLVEHYEGRATTRERVCG